MNNPFDYIEEYLAGELSYKDKQLFEEAMLNDSALRDEVEMVKEMELFTQRKAENSDALDVVRDVMDEGKRLEEGKRKGSSLVKSVVVVVGLCLLSLTAWVFLSQQENEVNHDVLFATYFQPESASFVMKSTGIDSSLIKAENAFNIQEYQTAINFFNQISEESKNNPDVIYFKSISELALGNTKESETGLNQLPIEFTNDVIWYKALIHLKSDRLDKVINLLSELPSDSAYKIRSEELISKLSE